MLNYLWAFMILIGIAVAIGGGRIESVTNGSLESAVETVNIVLRMAGVVAMWAGLMRVAEKSGLIAALTKKMTPILKFLFPNVPKDGKAAEYISTNFIANLLGLGWAATPAGIAAMEELQKLNPDKKRASPEMCAFLIINMSSLQLVTVNLLAYRSQYDSVNPAEIIAPGLAATIVSTVAAVIAIKMFEMFDRGEKAV